MADTLIRKYLVRFALYVGLLAGNQLGELAGFIGENEGVHFALAFELFFKVVAVTH
jgi:hypothetical protein